MTDIADATDNSFISFETGNSNSRDKETLIIKRIVIKVKTSYTDARLKDGWLINNKLLL